MTRQPGGFPPGCLAVRRFVKYNMNNVLLCVSRSGAMRIGSEVTEEELQLLLEPVLRSLILKEDFSAPTFEDAAYTAILTALTTGTLNAGIAQVNTDTPTASPADYTPYLEQLKQAQRNKKVRDLQDAYRKFLDAEQSMQTMPTKGDSKKIEKSMVEQYNATIQSIIKVDAASVLQEAKNGTRHKGVYTDAINKKAEKIEKSIASHTTQVEEHLDKIKNPAKYDKGWDLKDARQKEGLIRKWEKDLRRNAEQAEIEIEVWKERFGK